MEFERGLLTSTIQENSVSHFLVNTCYCVFVVEAWILSTENVLEPIAD